jgi:iron complex outermembrane receptor protein
MVLANGADAPDAWRMTSGGARLDWFPSKTDTLTLQGDLYSGREHTTPGETTMNGHNVLGRWTRAVAPDSEASLQFYYDRTRRDTPPNALTDKLQTYDLDFQHRFPTGERSLIVWGAGYRNLRSAALHSTPRIAFLPRVRDMDLFSGFLQDELSLVPERLKLILGSKLEHNVYSGFEVQPTARIAWTPDRQQMTWAAISRAVRSPSRIDVDYHIPGVDIEPGTPGVDGGPDFDSEKVIAYELGYRVQPAAAVALSLAAFYNRYDDIYSVEALPGTPTYRIQNGTEGHSWGAELSGSWQIAPWWRVRGGASLFRKHLWSKPGHSFDPASLGNDPERQWVLHSMMELPGRLQLDLTARYVGALPNPVVPNYLVADVRVAWQVADWEFSVIGQNLGDKQHPEFSAQSQVPRAVHGRVTFRW